MPHPIKAVAGLCVTALALSLAAGTARAVPTADPTTTPTTTPTSTPDTYTWSCDTNPGFIAVDDTDRVWHYDTKNFGTDKTVHTPRKAVSIDAKGHLVVPGRDGVIFSWHKNHLYLHTSDDGTNYSTRELKDERGRSGKWFGDSISQERFAVDANNNIYVVFNGVIIRYSWDFDANRWATWREVIYFNQRKLDGNVTGLAASGTTSFYIETSKGSQYRMFYDAETHRVLTQPARTGGGWGGVKFESSGDADSMLVVHGKELWLYRFHGTKNKNLLFQHAVGNSGWDKMKQVALFHGHCTNNNPKVSIPKLRWERPTVVNAAGHPTENKAGIGYVNLRGLLTFGNVTGTDDPSWDSTLAWQVFREKDAYVGSATLAYTKGNARVMAARNAENDVVIHIEDIHRGSLTRRVEMGGALATSPTAVYTDEIGKGVLVGLAEDGSIWTSSLVQRPSGSTIYTDVSSWYQRVSGGNIDTAVQPVVMAQGRSLHVYLATRASTILHVVLNAGSWEITKRQELLPLPDTKGVRGISVASLPHGSARVVATSTEGSAYALAQDPFGGWGEQWTALDFDGATVLGSATVTYDPHGVLTHVFARTAGEPGEPKKLWQASESIDVPGEYRRPITLAEGHFTYDPTPLTVNTSAGIRFGAVCIEGTQAKYWASKPVQVNPMWWAYRSNIPELTILRAQAKADARAQLADVEFTPVAKFGVKQ